MIDQIKLDFNQPQLRYVTARGTKEGISVWGRGTGKSSIIAWDMHKIVSTMPRSCWVIVGSTYKQVLTRTLPSTVASLERLGYKLNRDFYIGRKPPPSLNWEHPYQGPLSYDHFIIFRNGTGFHLVSLDAGGSASRGLNVDGFIGDEALLFDKQKLDADLSATNRGNGQYFGQNPMHHGVFLFSSMPWGDQGRWLLEKSNYYEDQGVDLIERQNTLIDAQVRFLDALSDEEKLHLWKEQVLPLMKDVRYFPSQRARGTFYSEANAFDNIQHLGLQYLLDQRRFMTDFTFQIEMMNRRPTTVEGGFYPLLNQAVHVQECDDDDFVLGLALGEKDMGRNLKQLAAAGGPLRPGDEDLRDSRADSDCRRHLPLRVSVDWGARITTMLVGQLHQDVREYRILKGFYVKHPAFIDELVGAFCQYYRHQQRRDIQFLADEEHGDARRPDSEFTLNEALMRAFQKQGWRIQRFGMGRIPGHATRYLLAQQLLGESDPSLLRIRFNKVNCRDVVTAMLLTPVSQDSKGRIQKVKKSETKLSFPAEHATHYTDNVDLHLLSVGTDVVNAAPDFSQLIIVSS
ncbi:hypothetical protein Q5H93_24025 [Hymenobacter sp. ASUV-10]|uniref:Phage terminase large subunit N-terminal domain-containing protein n=1 Tax=Hymenobacter aranciens TaxID=3063996 RepID=A0ABT9BME2_9BACT|nr:hypothetical protein [Hymenobacter sp. ASUV-10]MDO7877826.1 hypothetical protein [Hymenobacter sp. ASUV-10]